MRTNQPADIPLNETGRAQAKQIAPLIATLPIQNSLRQPAQARARDKGADRPQPSPPLPRHS